MRGCLNETCEKRERGRIYGRNAIVVMVKQQRKNARRAHSGARERSCSGLLARRLQGASGVMTCSKHLTSIMFSFTKGQSWARLFATSRARRRESEPKSSIGVELTLGEASLSSVSRLCRRRNLSAAASAASLEAFFPSKF